jgi:hypothetical protein
MLAGFRLVGYQFADYSSPGVPWGEVMRISLRRRGVPVVTRVAPVFAAVCGALVLGLCSLAAHPHDDEPEIVDVRGTLTRIDAVHNTVEVDTVDPRTRAIRNQLLFVDRRAKIRNGKVRISLAELQPGQSVACVVERQRRPGQEDRLLAFEIRLDRRS